LAAFPSAIALSLWLARSIGVANPIEADPAYPRRSGAARPLRRLGSTRRALVSPSAAQRGPFP